MAVSTTRDLAELSLAPSETERGKAARTQNMIRSHLEEDRSLRKYSVSTYLQGSYKNSTNVRGDSDVDMGCATETSFFYDLTDLPDKKEYQWQASSLLEEVQASITPATYTYWDYRRDVYASLKTEYGAVEDGNKAITIAGNTYRLDADVLPCLVHRQYYQNASGRPAYHQGIAFLTSTNERIVNFPQQHFENLSDKDQRNGGKVKGSIRILKRIRNELEERGQWDRKRSPSFYLESLVWNVPDSKFSGSYATVLENVLRHLWLDLQEKKDNGDLRSYLQANRIFVLFHPKFWNVDDAIAFIEVIWQNVFVNNG